VIIRVRAEARVTDGIEAEAETQATSETPEPE